ncbi:hypothetical protein GLAREA_08333 [Glarea lozoyensis ATCC 20868]|uniref:Uncharacterized protein n=1 Tax=Glarea lozoyensis (strain ATCC 20868 / MF5171) TaxID=1116229 RepID=S3CXC8_GLAL2|nr:uncharacterized protein GLAREA_08333 [Glarea lozoyensis ATCC 20868]EPE24481.1 hypothetical protein GLAREA_08333 [Glarea lozoyensis ATCC 20868]
MRLGLLARQKVGHLPQPKPFARPLPSGSGGVLSVAPVQLHSVTFTILFSLSGRLEKEHIYAAPSSLVCISTSTKLLPACLSLLSSSSLFLEPNLRIYDAFPIAT